MRNAYINFNKNNYKRITEEDIRTLVNWKGEFINEDVPLAFNMLKSSKIKESITSFCWRCRNSNYAILYDSQLRCVKCDGQFFNSFGTFHPYYRNLMNAYLEEISICKKNKEPYRSRYCFEPQLPQKDS